MENDAFEKLQNLFDDILLARKSWFMNLKLFVVSAVAAVFLLGRGAGGQSPGLRSKSVPAEAGVTAHSWLGSDHCEQLEVSELVFKAKAQPKRAATVRD